MRCALRIQRDRILWSQFKYFCGSEVSLVLSAKLCVCRSQIGIIPILRLRYLAKRFNRLFILLITKQRDYTDLGVIQGRNWIVMGSDIKLFQRFAVTADWPHGTGVASISRSISAVAGV